MRAEDLLAAGAALFVLGMIWLRTRMFYARQRAGPMVLTRAGTAYFASVVLLLTLAWAAAAPLLALFWPNGHVAAPVARVVCFLLIYYGFIPVHSLLRSRGLEIYRQRDQLREAGR